AFSTAPFSWEEVEGSTVRLTWKGSLDGEGSRELLLTKTFTFSPKGGIKALYELKNLGDELEAAFGVEFNLFFASLALGGGWMEVNGRRHPILEELNLAEVPRVLFFDKAAGAKLELRWGKAARLFAFPVRTVSQSERGFEQTPQGLALLPSWRIAIPRGRRWRVTIHLSVGRV
ncbi:MAG: alpha-amylase/4-alpha-glucanotransferase domain-containing protein, partial [Candidatus Methylomirabilales bacterium]